VIGTTGDSFDDALTDPSIGLQSKHNDGQGRIQRGDSRPFYSKSVDRTGVT